MYPDPENVEGIKQLLSSKGFQNCFKENSLIRHLHQRMRNQKCLTYKDYWLILSKDDNELENLKRTFSINTTSFFRDSEIFNIFRTLFQIYVREILDRNNLNKINIWSAGCANGSEPYSIAIIIHQVLKHQLDKYTVRILATDFNNRILNKARTGTYDKKELKGLSQEIIDQFFIKTDNSHYQVIDTIRNFVKFAFVDLGGNSFPSRHQDVIFCRYVLMYFQKSQNERLVKRFYELLNPGGLLILGGTDPMLLPLQNLFTCIGPGIFQKPLNDQQRRQVVKAHPENRFFCEWCGEPFASEKMMRFHVEHSQCRLGSFQCYTCGKALFTKTGLLAHLKYTHYIDRNDPVTIIFNTGKSNGRNNATIIK